MASPIEVLKSRFRGLYVIALIGLAVIFLIVSYILSHFDPSTTTSPLLRFGIAVTQKLGTDFVSLLIFTLILLYAIRDDPKQDIRTTTPHDATRALDFALARTSEFIYVGSTGGVQHRVQSSAPGNSCTCTELNFGDNFSFATSVHVTSSRDGGKDRRRRNTRRCTTSNSCRSLSSPSLSSRDK